MSKGRTPVQAGGPFLFALLLTACGETTRPSSQEQEQLNNAAEMLDSAPNELADIDENALGETEANSAEPAP